MFPRIPLENLELSKIVAGTNQFVGISHRNGFISFIYSKKFSNIRKIVDILLYLFYRHGVNCCISSPRIKIAKAIERIESETGEPYYWICTPSERKTVPGLEPDIFKQIDWCAEHNVAVCMPHRTYTDRNLDPVTLKIKKMDEIIPYIRDRGMIPGLSTHKCKVIKAVRKHGYDIKLITQPLNLKGYMSDVPLHVLIRSILNTDIQILNIKPMAAGRINPKRAIPFCLRHIKQNDFMAFGYASKKQAAKTARIIEYFLGTLIETTEEFEDDG